MMQVGPTPGRWKVSGNPSGLTNHGRPIKLPSDGGDVEKTRYSMISLTVLGSWGCHWPCRYPASSIPCNVSGERIRAATETPSEARTAKMCAGGRTIFTPNLVSRWLGLRRNDGGEINTLKLSRDRNDATSEAAGKTAEFRRRTSLMRFKVRLLQYACFSSGGQRDQGVFKDDSSSRTSAHTLGVHTSNIALFHSTNRLQKPINSSIYHQGGFHLSRDSIVPTSSIFLRPCRSGVIAKKAFKWTGNEVLIGKGNNVKRVPMTDPPVSGVASSTDGNSLSA